MSQPTPPQVDFSSVKVIDPSKIYTSVLTYQYAMFVELVSAPIDETPWTVDVLDYIEKARYDNAFLTVNARMFRRDTGCRGASFKPLRDWTSMCYKANGDAFSVKSLKGTVLSAILDAKSSCPEMNQASLTIVSPHASSVLARIVPEWAVEQGGIIDPVDAINRRTVLTYSSRKSMTLEKLNDLIWLALPLNEEPSRDPYCAILDAVLPVGFNHY